MARARHRDVEQAPLLLDLGGVAGRHVRRNAAVDDAQHRDRAPLLALGGMDRRQDQVVLVVAAGAPDSSLVAAGGSSGELGQEALARRVAAGEPDQVGDVGGARRGVVVQALEQRPVPALDRGELARPGRSRRRAARANSATNSRHAGAIAGGGANESSTRDRIVGLARAPRAAGRRSPRRCRERAAARASAARWPRGLAAKRSTASTSLTCAASRNFRPPYLTNGMSRRASSSSSALLCWALRKSTAWLFSARPDSRSARTRSATHDASAASSSTQTSAGRSPAAPVAPELLGVALARPAR